MPLTPQDVQSKEFATTRFKPGYDEEEVDAFLDEVEAELTRLLTENADLRNRINQMQAAATTAPAQAVAAPAVVEPVVAAQPEPVVAAAPVPVVPAEAPDQAALRTLQMAQRTADSAVAEAKAEADKLVGDARLRAADLEREAQTRHTTVMGQLESQRVALEARVEDLRAFEREYRTRLKAYLETQLRDLDGRAPADGGVAPAAPVASTPAAPVAPAAPAAAAAPAPTGLGQGVPGLATPAPNPYAPAAAGNPYTPQPAGGNPYATHAAFESDDEGPEPSGS